MREATPEQKKAAEVKKIVQAATATAKLNDAIKARIDYVTKEAEGRAAARDLIVNAEVTNVYE